MHVPFRIHHRNNLIDKKDSYPIPRSPSWDNRNCSYGHQLYLSDNRKLWTSIIYCPLVRKDMDLKSTCDVNLLSKLSIIFNEWRVMNNRDRGGVIVLFAL